MLNHTHTLRTHTHTHTVTHAHTLTHYTHTRARAVAQVYCSAGRTLSGGTKPKVKARPRARVAHGGRFGARGIASHAQAHAHARGSLVRAVAPVAPVDGSHRT
jgi:hypothetical protein